MEWIKNGMEINKWIERMEWTKNGISHISIPESRISWTLK